MLLLALSDGEELDAPYGITARLRWHVDAEGRHTLEDDGTLAARLYPIIAGYW